MAKAKKAKTETVDLTEDRVFFLGTSLIYRCVCAPKSWSADDVSADVTAKDPPGTSANRWVITDNSVEREEPFNNGNGIQCPDDENRRHWLMNC